MLDHTAAIAHLRTDPILAPIIDAVGPCTLQRGATGFPTLVRAIVGQQISIKAAAAINQKLQDFVGELTPIAVLRHTPDELRSVGLSNQKARYVLDLAAKAADGLDWAAHETMDDEAIIAQLIVVKGIGRWTVEMYLMFALGRPDVLPVADLGLQQGVQRAYGLSSLPKTAQLQAIAAPWRPFRSIATWYMWRSLVLPTSS